LLRPLIKTVAREQKMEATFMAKPYSGTAGSGMHVHVSLVKGGRNVFAGMPGMTDTLRHAVGGLAATMHEAMAIFAPNANAFRRFTPNLFVPVNRRWGVNNRSTGLRIPAGEDEAMRIEHRVAGADANPYLVLAAILLGIKHGLDNRIDPGPPHEGDASDFLDPTVPFEIMWAPMSTSMPRRSGSNTSASTRRSPRTSTTGICKAAYRWLPVRSIISRSASSSPVRCQ
jgi:glutamine synthetase